MSIDHDLKKEVLTRLLHAHPAGLGKEVLDNFRGEHAVAAMLRHLQEGGLIHDGSVSSAAEEQVIHYPIKLSASGVEAAKLVDV
ncbi:hypothetical protein [Phytopseudomonas dryadis]|uniref:Uncharacterized protein n=1 Tax=Phytopseudomonas dryadis TaxID=2487520 RepID=A0A4Q9RBG9_9GAMM|nr:MULTISPECIES: hypothetical protein [Pseudomonas]TBU97558.1 hypothetical protein DNK44_00805 [Pseudomonas dryadis]TBV10013.1 hypothetical protein DNK34_00815 [Pseudomonas dryadis]TBV19158.1 hypothetical protein DNK41_05430 [Pseudomonas sp. FRB 230]